MTDDDDTVRRGSNNKILTSLTEEKQRAVSTHYAGEEVIIYLNYHVPERTYGESYGTGDGTEREL